MKRSDAGDVSPVAMFYPDGMLFQDFSLSNASLRGSNTIIEVKLQLSVRQIVYPTYHNNLTNGSYLLH